MTLQERLDDEIANSKLTFSCLRGIVESAASMVESGYFSDAYKIHEFAVYLLNQQNRICGLRDAIGIVREQEAETADSAPEVVCN